MSVAHPFTKPTRVLRDFSGQVAISIAASAVAAAFFALPDALQPVPSPAAGPSAATMWSVPLTPDGKFATRLDVPAEPARPDMASGPATPAALAMPLAIAWSIPAAEPQVAAVTAGPQPQARVAHGEVTPARRTLIVERARVEEKLAPEPVGRPLAIAAVAAAAPVEAPRPPGLIGRVVAEPAARAAGLVSGAAGMVGAAGSWTVAQATSLLPRW